MLQKRYSTYRTSIVQVQIIVEKKIKDGNHLVIDLSICRGRYPVAARERVFDRRV